MLITIYIRYHSDCLLMPFFLGIEKGIEQGAEQERINNARNFLHLGVAVDIISKATGLSEEEILALA